VSEGVVLTAHQHNTVPFMLIVGEENIHHNKNKII